MAIEEMRKAYATDEVRELIESRMKALRDWKSSVAADLAASKAEGKAEVLLQLARDMKTRGIDDGARPYTALMLEFPERSWQPECSFPGWASCSAAMTLSSASVGYAATHCVYATEAWT